ncbi:MAG: histidine kinase [Eubacteriales bacterium]|nr:histidine kinase [Eubacteriales bacterium]
MNGGSIKTKVLLFLGFIMAAFLFSNLYSIKVNRESERQMNQLLSRYYAINEFSRIYRESSELWMRGSGDGTERAAGLNRQMEELLETMAADTDTLSETGFLMVQSVRNLYMNYRKLQREELFSGNAVHRELKLWEIDTLIKQYTEKLLQDSLSLGYTAHQTLQTHVQNGQRNAVFFMAAVVAACAAFGRYMTKWLLNPIISLASFVREVGQEKFDGQRLSETRKDEIGELNREVNQMRDSMKSTIVALQEKQQLSWQLHDQEMKLERAKFAALQSQINPHFLFNTLNVIYGMADMEHAGVTAELIQSLSGIFRYSMENKVERVLLSRELAFIRDYIYIEKRRFGKRLSYILKADVDPDRFEIPPFTLQPLVENSIKHGILVRKEGGWAAVRILVRDGWLVIRVIDNGVGMDREKQKQLLGSEGGSGRGVSGIGAGNVFTRLKLMFPDCRIRIMGRPGRGTCLEIKIKAEECGQ